MCSLQFLDLLQSTHVPLSSVELRFQKRSYQLTGQFFPDHSGADAEDVHVVVLDSLVRGVRVVADRGPDTSELAGRDRGADSRAADEDTAISAPVLDRLADLGRLVGVVDLRLRRVRSEVDHLVSQSLDFLEHARAQLDPAVVERDRNSHREVTLPGMDGPELWRELG